MRDMSGRLIDVGFAPPRVELARTAEVGWYVAEVGVDSAPSMFCVTRAETMAESLSVQRKPIMFSRVSMYMTRGSLAFSFVPPRFSRPYAVLWCCWPNATTSTSSTMTAEWYARFEGRGPFSGGAR